MEKNNNEMRKKRKEKQISVKQICCELKELSIKWKQAPHTHTFLVSKCHKCPSQAVDSCFRVSGLVKSSHSDLIFSEEFCSFLLEQFYRFIRRSCELNCLKKVEIY